MNDIFKIWMISLDWEAPNQLKDFTKSKKPLKGEYEDGIFKFDIVTYDKVEGKYFQFAIESTNTPYLSNGESPLSPLSRIDENLWINQGEWRVGTTGRGYHYCSSVNTVGKLNLVIKDQVDQKDKASIEIDINPSIDNFDFEELKNDFEGDLWNLITTPNAKVTTDRREIKWREMPITFRDAQLALSFLDAFDRVLKNPKKELVHTIHRTSIDKVRPTQATYREIATSGKRNNLPSRGYKESLDHYENRALCQMLFLVGQLVSRSIQFATLQNKRTLRQIAAIQQQIKELEQPQKVNPLVIEQELAKQEALYETWRENWKRERDSVLANCNNEDCWISKIIEIRHNSDYNGDIWGVFGGEYGLISFPTDISKILEGGKSQKIQIQAHCFKDKFNKAGTWPIFHVKAISSIELLDINYPHIIEKQKKNYQKLKDNNWELEAILNQKEKDKLKKERKRQVQTLNKRIGRLEKQRQNFRQILQELQIIQPDITWRLNSDFVKSINWKNFSGFKPSMTYLQNKNYKDAFAAFQRLIEESVGDIKLFDLYEQISSYGIREIPQVYELWCLLRLINCLEEDFNFRHHPADLEDLLRAISPKNKEISNHCRIRFDGDLAGRSVILHYQYSLPSGKRPDFLLEIDSEYRKIHLVLDAKYKNYNYKKSVSIESKNMFDKYGEEFLHYVFILHPCEDKVHEEFTSILTNLGGSTMYLEDEQQVFPFHQYGNLQISPNQENNLKKVLGMAFEYLIEYSTTAKKEGNKLDPMPDQPLFCLNCGSNEMEAEKMERDNKRCHYTCTCQNESCKHEMYLDYCWNCKTRLFKHGRYWDYHRTSVWSIFDIHCPNCGMTVSDYPSR